MTRRRLTAALAATVLLAGLHRPAPTTDSSTAAPDDAPSTSSEHRRPRRRRRPRREPSTPRSATPSRTASTPTSATRRSTPCTTTSTSTWDPDGRTLTGDEELTFRSTADADHVQLDLAEQLEVSALQVDGQDASSSTTARTSSSRATSRRTSGTCCRIDYSGSPRAGPGADHPPRLQHHRLHGQPTTDRRGRCRSRTAPTPGTPSTTSPSDKAFYDFTLRVAGAVDGRGQRGADQRDEEDGQTVTEWHLDSKTSSYLVTVAFGDYKVTEDESASGVPLSYWVPTSASRLPRRRCATPARRSPGSRTSSAPIRGRRSASCSSTPSSGMETQTMITLGDTRVHHRRQGVIVHEIVHQWYGDQVTPSDWSDLWMNEGMAMYLQFVWQAEYYRPARSRRS